MYLLRVGRLMSQSLCIRGFSELIVSVSIKQCYYLMGFCQRSGAGLPNFTPFARAFAMPLRTLSTIIFRSNSAKTPASRRKAFVIASILSVDVQSIVSESLIISFKCFSLIKSIKSHNCFVLRVSLLISVVTIVSPVCTVLSNLINSVCLL